MGKHECSGALDSQHESLAAGFDYETWIDSFDLCLCQTEDGHQQDCSADPYPTKT